MLSGETAKGKYPDDTVTMMNNIILSAERYASSDAIGSQYLMHGGDRALFEGEKDDLDAAVAEAAVTASLTHGSKAILVIAETGALPKLVSSYRPDCPIVTFCPSSKMGRQLILWRGIYPVVGLSGGLSGISEGKIAHVAMKEAQNMGFISAGDSVVIVHVDKEFGGSANFKITNVPTEDY
jgi:pyruvate kinase